MVRQHQTSDAQLRIGESRDSPMCNCTSEFDASHRPGMTGKKNHAPQKYLHHFR
jgi:hypothetical protein